MLTCPSCGKKVKDFMSVCPHCEEFLDSDISDYSSSKPLKKRSAWWYGLPIAFGIVGGVAAYFAIHDTDPKRAKECLIIGIGMLAVWFFGFF
jgi:hypothetical protein